MPTVAIVEGIRIRFYSDEHPPPHLHAVLAEYQTQIGIDPPVCSTAVCPATPDLVSSCVVIGRVA
jgi:hypothetical protein